MGSQVFFDVEYESQNASMYTPGRDLPLVLGPLRELWTILAPLFVVPMPIAPLSTTESAPITNCS